MREKVVGSMGLEVPLGQKDFRGWATRGMSWQDRRRSSSSWLPEIEILEQMQVTNVTGQLPWATTDHTGREATCWYPPANGKPLELQITTCLTSICL